MIIREVKFNSRVFWGGITGGNKKNAFKIEFDMFI